MRHGTKMIMLTMLVVIAPGAQILVLVDEGIPRMTSACDNYPDNMVAWIGDHST